MQERHVARATQSRACARRGPLPRRKSPWPPCPPEALHQLRESAALDPRARRSQRSRAALQCGRMQRQAARLPPAHLTTASTPRSRKAQEVRSFIHVLLWRKLKSALAFTFMSFGCLRRCATRTKNAHQKLVQNARADFVHSFVAWHCQCTALHCSATAVPLPVAVPVAVCAPCAADDTLHISAWCTLAAARVCRK